MVNKDEYIKLPVSNCVFRRRETEDLKEQHNDTELNSRQSVLSDVMFATV